ncbi:hypothetical protein NIES4072_07300 [Nostoc commune NIES-4072]|uniref:Uncharacterized protein n=1 Tax=Nostoc commune NIES-4072 TaxID=2005467 RepID=A0A2R5FMS4_NOSCO|nr:hypothetical protein NIES4070_19530 [Nostoc commune HK-02]GBG17081.1 hypothetical protein NIES4072_07300 [Nostoc commune NIES-4072]
MLIRKCRNPVVIFLTYVDVCCIKNILVLLSLSLTAYIYVIFSVLILDMFKLCIFEKKTSFSSSYLYEYEYRRYLLFFDN